MPARLIALVALCLGLSTLPAAAERERIGYGRLLNNDSVLADWKDRWQTGNVVSSRIWGPAWAGTLPDAPGDLLELRLNFQVIAPSNLTAAVDPADRPMAGVLSLGGHTHFDWRGFETAAGLDLVVTGPQTGMVDLQEAFHDVIGYGSTNQGQKDGQIGNGVYPTGVLEMARSYSMPFGTLRPFAELRAGAETLARIGADVNFGDFGVGELLVRDPVTGHRYRTIANEDWRGTAFVLGADFAYVDDSVFLPGNGTYAMEDNRSSVRAGFHWQGDEFSGFYGLTYLSEEFTTQPEGQLVGSIRLQRTF